MDVLFLSPHHPVEMHHFTRGLAEVGARVWAVGDCPSEALPPAVRQHLSGYLHVPRIMDEDDLVRRVLAWLGGRSPDRVETLWEPLIIAAARLREQLGVDGLSVDAAWGFRDKVLMRQRVAAAGLRVPRAGRARTVREVWALAEQLGFPLVVKPIAGAGSQNTFRADSPRELEAKLPMVREVDEVAVEEFIDGDELTFDAVCVEGQVVYRSVTQYMPRPLISRYEEWISPAQITHRDLSRPDLQGGLALGEGVVRALGMRTGFVHMEWFRRPSGEVVLGEIGCRSGGGHLTDMMNFTGDIDIFREWARAVCWHSFEASLDRKYYTGAVFKRAHGQGRLRRIEGLDRFRQRYGAHICWENFLPIGQPRRDWTQVLAGDGFLMVRHPEWEPTLRMVQEAAGTIHLIAG